ncbi:hypothetical protein AR457_34410 [Streptomyces agglomeratus]|nr:hypothetical protein AR457_34410 [Streptomyces agglomeratus]
MYVFEQLLSESLSEHRLLSGTISGRQPQEQHGRLTQKNAGALQRGECAPDLMPAHARLQCCVDSRQRHGVHPQHEPVHGLQRLLRICHHLPLKLFP